MEFDAIARIEQLCQARGWTYYRLAKESGITYSTLNTMVHKSNAPSISTLCKLCDGFGITLSQFFAEEDETALLRRDQKDCLQSWEALSSSGKALALAYMQGLADQGKN